MDGTNISEIDNAGSSDSVKSIVELFFERREGSLHGVILFRMQGDIVGIDLNIVDIR